MAPAPAVCTHMEDMHTLNIHRNCNTEPNQGERTAQPFLTEERGTAACRKSSTSSSRKMLGRRCLLRSTEDSHRRAAPWQHQNPVGVFRSYGRSNPPPRG